MQAKNINGTNLEMVKNQFAQATADGYKPTLAIVFCSIVQDRAEIRQFLSSHHIQVFGATTAGEIQDNEVTEQSTVIMLLDAKLDTFHLYLQEATEDNTYQKCQNLAKKAMELYKNPSIVLVSSGLRIDAEMIIKGVKDTSNHIDLFGGLAGDDLTMNASYVFDQNNEYPVGILGLIIDGDKIQVSGQATCGWDNIGIEKTITKSEGNVVYTIDDEPAVDVFVKFFQYKGNVITKAEIIAMNFAQYPLQMTKPDGHVVLRAPLMVNVESQALIFAGGIPQGSKVKFSVPPGFDLVEKSAAEISLLKATIPEADAILMFSCKARHLSLGPLTSEEASMIRAIWDKPLIGFFTYGEIGAALGAPCDFHNETCSMVVLKEK